MDTSRERDIIGRTDDMTTGADRRGLDDGQAFDRLGRERDGLERDGLERDADGNLTVTAHAERLVAGTEQFEGGRVRVRRRIVTEERQVTVQVQREELVVERADGSVVDETPTSGTRVAADPDQSRVIEEYVLHETVPRIEYDVVAVEKVRILADRHVEDVHVSDTVAREHIVVEGDGDVTHRVADTGPSRIVGDEPDRIGDRDDLDERDTLR